MTSKHNYATFTYKDCLFLKSLKQKLELGLETPGQRIEKSDQTFWRKVQ